MRIFGISRRDWEQRIVKISALIWRRLLFRTTFVAITGSVGKTTTKELLAAVLPSQGATLATVDSRNSAIEVARTILGVRPWHRFVVLEIGTDRPGWIRSSTRLARPDIAVVLKVGRTHTDRFPTLEDTAREKAALLSTLGRRGVAILNQDDPRVAAMAEGHKFRVVRFGESDQADVRATEMAAIFPERLSLTVIARGESERVQTNLVGTHWAAAVLAAAAAALECGVPLARIAEAFNRVQPTPGRLDPRILPSGAVVLRDDFNGALETFNVAFAVLREASAKRKILAVSTVSDSDEGWDKRLCRIVFDAAAACDMVVLIGTAKDTQRAVRSAAAAGMAPEVVHCFTTIRDAAGFLRGVLRAGDLLLLRGRYSDHMGRLFHALTEEVRCWLDRCELPVLCEKCPRLYAENAESLPVPRRGDS